MAPSKSTFTIEDLNLMLTLSRRLVETKFGQFKGDLVQNFHEIIDPDTRLAGRVRARYDTLRSAGFTHEEAVQHTTTSVNRTVDRTLDSLKQTETEGKN